MRFQGLHSKCIKVDRTHSSQGARGSSLRTRICFIPGLSSLKAQNSSKIKAHSSKEPMLSGSQESWRLSRSPSPRPPNLCTGLPHPASSTLPPGNLTSTPAGECNPAAQVRKHKPKEAKSCALRHTANKELLCNFSSIHLAITYCVLANAGDFCLAKVKQVGGI